MNEKPLNLEKTTSSVLFVISKVYDIGLQRYSTKKIRVCGKNLIPLLVLLNFPSYVKFKIQTDTYRNMLEIIR